MSNISKIFLIIAFAFTLNVFAIINFDYKEYFDDSIEKIEIKESKSLVQIIFDKSFYSSSNYTIEKSNNLLFISGNFSSYNTLTALQEALDINLSKDIKIDENSRLNQNIVNDIYEVINFLKNNMENGSKIVVNNDFAVFEGTLVNNRYSNLVKLIENKLDSNYFLVDIDTLEFN
ncbi:hypothetical protein [Arcobacter porcinus]|uniref:Uncharacterized protein n=1 Tax=Arcobacter porcinus TaxID=1935204 RepID=A0A5C2HE09_9BACT|nr:hypothetical protein [Arcobacter porcinus]OCL84767.1 hypothetical protein AAW29_00446 [Arcobacter porcinus]OCL97341.1 hypothetical protein AAX27_00249 [Aliarcobacter thereius]QEP39661.1 hypothetical protein APORC_0020 [Arcobacter porcinus]